MESLFDRRGESSPARLAAFHGWLRGNGATYEAIDWPHAFETTGGARGAIALRDIEPNDVMLSIPERLMLSIPTVQRSGYGSVFTDEFMRMHTDDQVSLGERSFFHPYIAILPRPSSVTLWSAEQQSELQDASFMARVSRASAAHRTDYDEIFEGTREDGLFFQDPSLFPRDVFSFDTYLWCYLTVCARCFGRRLPYLALVPLADCLNHANLQTKYDFNTDGNGLFRLFPTGSNRYAKGGEAFNSYGRRDNALLLLEYGFCIPDNEWETVPLSVKANHAEFNSPRWRLLTRFGLHSEHVGARSLSLPAQSMTLSSRNPAWSLLAFFRIECSAVETDLPPSARIDKEPLSLENESAALHSARGEIERLLGLWRTTLEDDQEFLELGDLSDELHQALQYRVTRKRILRLHLELFDLMLLVVASARGGSKRPLEEAHPCARVAALAARADVREWAEAVQRCA